MADDIEKPDDEQAGDKPEGPLAGERLAFARKEQQITVLEVAKELHLDEHKVRALENNQFDVLGAPVFAKGHLRKYSQLVGVAIEDVLAEYYMLNRSSGMPPVVGRVRKTAREISLGPWIAAIVVLALAAAAYWWFAIRVPSTPPSTGPQAVALPVTSNVDEEPVDQTPVANEIAVDEPGDNTTDSVAIEPAAAEPAAAVIDAVNQPAPAVAGEARIEVTFNGDCWTEITDAGGRRLFFDLGRSGRTVNVSGEAPLSVVFGDADNVSLSVNGVAYPISEVQRSGQMARLTIASP